MGIVCFADESRRGNRLCVAIVCFEGSLSTAGRKVYDAIVEMLEWKRGELKYRSVSKAARNRRIPVEQIVSLIALHSAGYAAACMGVSNPSHDAKERMLVDALRRLNMEEINLVVVDEQLVRGDRSFAKVKRLSGKRIARMRFASSKKTLGLQLADIMAGCAAHEECRLL